MNKNEIITNMAVKSGLTKVDAEKALNAFKDTVTEALINGEKVQIVGFGNFEITNRNERIGRNPSTGEAMTIPASKTPKFKAGKALKDAVNDK